MNIFYTLFFLKENYFYSYIYISTLLFYYTQMKMTFLSRPPPNMNSIREVCKGSLTLFFENHRATGCLRPYDLIWPRVKGEVISDPLFAYTGLKCKLQQSLPVETKAPVSSLPQSHSPEDLGNNLKYHLNNFEYLVVRVNGEPPIYPSVEKGCTIKSYLFDKDEGLGTQISFVTSWLKST